MTTHDPEKGPCRSVRPLLDAAADGRQKGLRAWYARAHAARCPGCRRYLQALQGLVQKLREGKEAEDEAAITRLSRSLSE